MTLRTEQIENVPVLKSLNESCINDFGMTLEEINNELSMFAEEFHNACIASGKGEEL